MAAAPATLVKLAPPAWRVPSADEVIADAESMGALQMLVDFCCDGDAEQQKRALGIFLDRVGKVAQPQRRPRVLMAAPAPTAPATLSEAQDLLVHQAQVERQRQAEAAAADPDNEPITEALKSAPKVAKLSPEALLDDLIKKALLPLYRQGHKSFDIRPKWKGQNIPVYAETWSQALRRAGIHAPEPACQVTPGGGFRIALSFADLGAIAQPGLPAKV